MSAMGGASRSEKGMWGTMFERAVIGASGHSNEKGIGTFVRPRRTCTATGSQRFGRVPLAR